MSAVIDNKEKSTHKYMLLNGAEGGIQMKEFHDEGVVDKLVDDIQTDRLFEPTDKLIPCKCIDGRKCEMHTDGPNAAGGSLSLFVANDLTLPAVESESRGSVEDGVRDLIGRLSGKNLPVGAHCDNIHTDAEDSGCGANDRLQKIYDLIIRKPDIVKQHVETLLGAGSVDEETENLIQKNAKSRTEFTRGKKVFDLFGKDDKARTEELDGEHKEVIAVINMREGTTLDRGRLAEEYGPDYQVFCVDAWSFAHAAEAVSEDGREEDIRQKAIAMTYYNVAAALVLCGPGMRVVVRE